MLWQNEQYLDLIVVNGGPGVATNVNWCVEIIGYKENELALVGTIPVLEPQGKVNVQGYLKIKHDNRDRIMKAYKSEKNISPIDLSNEQIKEVEEKSNSIEKYRVKLCIKSFFLHRRKCFVLLFNEDGRYINRRSDRCCND